MTSARWQLCSPDPSEVARIAAACGCPAPIASLLASRGLGSAASLRSFFAPELNDLHPPELLLGMDRAVDRIDQAVSAGEAILIYGDYDVDGTIATVLLKTAIERLAPPGMQARVSWHVPHRIREGYGMRESRLGEACAAGIQLVISVDTGIRACAAAREARALGLDLIITDHHLTDEQAGVPDALAVINPAQEACTYSFKELCGAAVAFKLAHALLDRHARSAADSEAALAHLRNALLPSLLKVVAIATIADSVPLVGENRTIAMLGLRGLSRPVQPGLRALLEVSGLPADRSPTAREVGFRIAPRINAAGRMDIADDVIELLLTRSAPRAAELASKLNTLNEERRATEREALDAIELHLAQLLGEAAIYPAAALVLDSPGWHRGVLGILASRVVDRTGRPALVITHESSGEAHGSGRSVAGFHLLDALTAVHAMGCESAPAASLFTRFGGHAHAVGFSLASAHVSVLRERLAVHSRTGLTEEVLSPALRCDAEVAQGDLTCDLADWVERCAPFGNRHTEPVFMTRSLMLSGPPRVIQDRHLCLSLRSAPGSPALQAMGWSRNTGGGQAWPARAQHLQLGPGSTVDIVYRLRHKADAWFTGLELELLDVAPATAGSS